MDDKFTHEVSGLIEKYDEYMECINKIAFPVSKGNSKVTYHIAIYYDLLEITGALLHSLKKNDLVVIPPLLRSILEGVCDIDNIINIPDYCIRMEVPLYSGIFKVTTKSLEHNVLEGNNDINDELLGLSEKIDGYKKRGIKPIKMWEKFKLSGREYEYDVLYVFLSNFDHYNSFSINSKHINIKKNKLKVKYFNDKTNMNTSQDFLKSLSICIAAYNMTYLYKQIKTHFSLKVNTKMDSLIDCLDELQLKISGRNDLKFEGLSGF